MLTKFPVTTDRGEYRVDVHDYTFSEGWDADVYVKRKKPRWFSEFKKVHTIVARKFECNDLVSLAKSAVISYEESVAAGIARQFKTQLAIEAFHTWDGDMTTKEESR